MRRIISLMLFLCMCTTPIAALSQSADQVGTIIDKRIQPSYWQWVSKDSKSFQIRNPKYFIVTVEYFKENFSHPFLMDYRVPISVFSTLQIGDQVLFSEGNMDIPFRKLE